MQDTPVNVKIGGVNDGVKVELYVSEKAEAVIFHNRPFRKRMSWFEYDLKDSKLDFIMNDGDIRDFGLPIDPRLAKYLQNAFQVLLVEMDEATGQPKGSSYFPLIIHSV